MEFWVSCKEPTDKSYPTWGLREFTLHYGKEILFSKIGIVVFQREMKDWVNSGIISENQLIHFEGNCGDLKKYVAFAAVFLYDPWNFRDEIGL
jgi:hypothetical protein